VERALLLASLFGGKHCFESVFGRRVLGRSEETRDVELFLRGHLCICVILSMLDIMNIRPSQSASLTADR
jgi:hypothetical protein